MINEVINDHAKSITAKMDEIIKEVADQGWKYLVLKTTYEFEENKAKSIIQWQGRNSLEGLDGDIYEFYELDKVREYLNYIDPTEQPSE